VTLDPSQRVRLIKEIVNRLSSEEWSLVDVTLRQFSLPTSDDWRGEKGPYVAAMVERAPDDTLLALAKHAGFEFEQEPARLDPAFWRKGYLRLFASHLAGHRKEAAELQESFATLGISAFVAHNDIEPTSEWQTEIETALATTDCLVALLHPGFHASKWTDQEIGYAMGRSVPVFSVRLGEDPYGFIGRFQAFQGHGKSMGVLAREIFEVLVKHKQTRRRLAEALVLRLEESESFASAKANASLLENMTYWTPSFATRLRGAVESNSQVSGSWGTPERIKRLIDAHVGEGV
jgi:hypothetical protein